MKHQIRLFSAWLPLATLLLIALRTATSHSETLASAAYVCLAVLACVYAARKKYWANLVRFSLLGSALLPASCFAGTLTNTSLVVSSPSAGAASSVTIGYTLGTALVNGNNMIYAQLPSGFTISPVSTCSAAPFIVTLNGVTTSLGSSGLKSSICVTWNSNNIQINTGISIAAGTRITVTIPAANSTNPTTYGTKTMLSLRTILSSGLTIDSADTLPSTYINPSDVGTEPVGTASAVIPYVFKFSSNTTLNSTLPYQVMTQGVRGMDFADAGSSTCSGSFSAGDSCTVNFTFTPTSPGLRLGSVVLYDSTGSPVSTGMVYGHGTGPQVLFPPSTVISLGGTATFGGVIDPLGNVYVPSLTVINKIPAGCTSASCVTTLGGGFTLITSLALDGAGVLYAVDYSANALKTLSTSCTSSSCVTTLGGGFSSPFGVVVDGSGTLYVSDANNNAVKKVPAGCTSSSCVTTLVDGFDRPYPLALDSNSNIYVGEYSGNTVKVIPSGCTSSSCVTVVGGGFSQPYGLAVDASGTVFVANTGTSTVKTMPSTCTSSSCVTTFGSGYDSVRGVMLDASGNLYVDGTSSPVKMVTRTAAPALTFSSTNVGSTSSDSPQTVMIQNAGNSALQFPVPSSGKNPSVPANFAWDSASTCSQTSTRAITLAAGTSCAIAIDFKPTSAGTISGNVVLTDNNNNAAAPTYTTQSIPVSGVGVQVVDHFAFSVAPPSTTTAGSSFSVTVTAYSDSGTTVATNYSGHVVFTSSDSQAVFPTALTLTNGVGTFSITLKTAGSQTLTVADSGGSPSTTSGSITVTAASAASITSATGSGQSAIITNAFTNPLTVQVLDAYSNPVGNATVTFSVPSSGASATLSSTTCSTSSSATPAGGCGVTATANDTTGSYSVSASVAGASTSAIFSLTNASKTAQTITFVPASSQTFGTTPTLSAMATSGLTVSFTSATPGVCTVTSAGVLTFVEAGTCTINADQSGNSTYAAASRVQGSFTVNAIAPGAPQITATTTGDGQATVSFTAPTDTGGAPITEYIVTSTPDGLTATGTTSPITVSGLTNGATYTFTVTAKNSAGTGSPSAASPGVTLKNSQTISFPNPGTQTYGTTLSLVASSNSNLSVTFTSNTPAVCAVTAGGVVTFAGTGTCSIKADQAGNSSYLPAASVTQSFTVAKAAQTITFRAPAAVVYGSSTTVSLSATGGPSASAVTFTVTSGPATVSGSTLTLRGAGTVQITANQAGDDNYEAAAPVTQSLTISKASASLSGPTGTTQVVNGQSGSFNVSVTGQYTGAGIALPGGQVSYTIANSSNAVVASSTSAISNGAATIPIANTLSAGIYSVTVNYGGDTNFNAATPITVSLQVGQIQPTINWSAPSSLTYGATLASVLNAQAVNGSTAVAGTYSYVNGATAVTAGTVLPAGTYSLTVNFTPTDITTYKTATSSVALTVNKAVPAIALLSTTAALLVQNPVTLTATVSSTVGTPTGTVTFLEGSTPLGTSSLAGGVATLTTSALAVGTHSITAVYSSDTNFTAQTSGPSTVQVNDFDLTISNNGGGSTSQTVLPGGTATFNFTLSPIGANTFPAAANLSVSGLPTGATYTITPTTLAAGSAATNVVLTINVPSQVAMMQTGKRMAPIALALLMLPFGGALRRSAGKLSRLVAMLLLLIGGAAGMASLTGCGSSTGFFASPQSTYNVTITGTSGALSHSTTVTLTVQ